MSIDHKSPNLQVFRMLVYQRALHPELFDLQGRRAHRQHEYEVENWILPAGHVVRFHHQGHTLTEAVLDAGDHLPENGLIHALPCMGERDFEVTDESELGYVTTIQTEQLVENLYAATYREMIDFAHETGSLYHEYRDTDGSANLSLLDVQTYKREYHIQSYHLIGSTGLVLRTQSIFEMPGRSR